MKNVYDVFKTRHLVLPQFSCSLESLPGHYILFFLYIHLRNYEVNKPEVGTSSSRVFWPLITECNCARGLDVPRSSYTSNDAMHVHDDKRATPYVYTNPHPPPFPHYPLVTTTHERQICIKNFSIFFVPQFLLAYFFIFH